MLVHMRKIIKGRTYQPVENENSEGKNERKKGRKKFYLNDENDYMFGFINT